MSSSSGTRCAVRCPEYRTVHKSREAAERALARIEELGACRGPHTIEELDR